MPISIHDDVETALVQLAWVYETNNAETAFTGRQIAIALREIADDLHRIREKARKENLA